MIDSKSKNSLCDVTSLRTTSFPLITHFISEFSIQKYVFLGMYFCMFLSVGEIIWSAKTSKKTSIITNPTKGKHQKLNHP